MIFWQKSRSLTTNRFKNSFKLSSTVTLVYSNCPLVYSIQTAACQLTYTYRALSYALHNSRFGLSWSSYMQQCDTYSFYYEHEILQKLRSLEVCKFYIYQASRPMYIIWLTFFLSEPVYQVNVEELQAFMLRKAGNFFWRNRSTCRRQDGGEGIKHMAGSWRGVKGPRFIRSCMQYKAVYYVEK